MPSRAKPKPPPSESRPCPGAAVVDLAAARGRVLLRRYARRIRDGLERNREAFLRLYESGLVFTRHGTRMGCDILRAHQRLHKLADQVAGLENSGRLPARARVEALFARVDRLLARSGVLASRNHALFQR